MLDFFYTTPVWISTLTFILGFLVIATIGTLLTRKYLHRYIHTEPNWADVCSIFSNVIIVFFGLLLALITVAAYENFSHGFATTQTEANEISHMYGLTKAIPDPGGSALRADIKSYVDCVIDKEWPAQTQGKSPATLCRPPLNNFLHSLYEINPQRNSENVAYTEIMSSYGSFLDARRERLGQVDHTIPGMLWAVMYLGAFAMLATMFLLPVASKLTHIVISCLAGGSVALLILVTAAMDNPFRGDLRVAPSQYQDLEDAFTVIDKGRSALPPGQDHPDDRQSSPFPSARP